ncbi:hypothetical protein [Ralstonia syzygii]|uniref:hypothetical protein n=1 Tax=Ralstonia syzygii TaxID=28097 RepID=UPI0027DB6A8C|nr:hypothetical protein [Ralstonia syzygii]
MVSRTRRRTQPSGIPQPASPRITQAASLQGANPTRGRERPSSARSVPRRASSILDGLTNFKRGTPSASARSGPNIRAAVIDPTQQALPPELWQRIASSAGARPRRAMREVSRELRDASRAVVTHLTIRDPAVLRHLGKYPALKSLRLKGALTLDALKALPPGLEHLDLSRCTGSAMSSAGLAHLAARPLKSLCLIGCEIGDRAAEALAASFLAE